MEGAAPESGTGKAAMPQVSYTDLEEKLARAQRERDEALEQQKATAEILGVISSLPADVQPVFDTIVRNFALLCGSIFGAIYTFDGELVHFAGAFAAAANRNRRRAQGHQQFDVRLAYGARRFEPIRQACL